MTYKLNPFTGKLDTSEGPQGPAGVVSAAGPGSEGTPSISFAADLDTGLYNYTPNGIAVSTGGIGRLFIDSTGATRIEGTGGPSLIIKDTDSLSGSSTSYLRFWGSDAETGYIGYVGGSNYFINNSRSGGAILLRTENTERLRITSTGELQFKGAGTNGSPGTPAVRFNGSAPTNSLVVDSSGRLGVGTGSPLAELHLNDPIGLSRMRFTGGAAGADNFEIGQAIVGVSNSGFSIYDIDATATRFVIDSSGNVGIGTTSPQALCHVYGGPSSNTLPTNSQAIFEYSANGGIAISTPASTTAGVYFPRSTNNYYAGIERSGADLTLRNNGGTRATIDSNGTFRVKGAGVAGATDAVQLSGAAPSNSLIIDSSGRLGVGTGSPVQALTVSSATNYEGIYVGGNAAPNITFANGVGTWKAGNSGNNGSSFSISKGTANDDKLIIDSSGNVGIGTTSPAEKLDINVSSIIGFSIGDDPTDSTKLALRSYQGSTNNNVRSISYIGSDHRFQVGAVTGTTASEAVRIDTDGRLLVGTTGSVSTIPYLQVLGNPTNDAGAELYLGRREAATTPLTAGQSLGTIKFGDNAGKEFAVISANVDGSSAANDYPGRLVFSTTADGAPSPTPRMTIKNDGKVGIGTQSPAAKLQLSVGNSATTVQADTLAVRGTSGSWAAHIGATSEGGTFIARGNVSTKGQIIFGNTDGSYANYSETARIDSSGRLLVGTPSARSDLSFASVVPSIQLAGGTTSQSSLLLHKFGNDANPCKLILLKNKGSDASSNGGLSVNDPLGIISFEAADGYGGSTLIGAEIGAYAETGHGSANDDAPSRLVFSTTADGASTPTERMRITSGSQVWINTTTGTVDTSNYGTNIGLILNHARNTDGGNAVAQFHGNLGTARVMGNGDLQNTNDVYGAISDIKLKENIVDAESQWDDFKAVRFRKYNFKEETGYETFTQLGVIAQELELVSPGLVTETPDLDEDGNDLGTTTKSVKYSILTKKALVALQEAMERIEQLEAKVAALEAQ